MSSRKEIPPDSGNLASELNENGNAEQQDVLIVNSTTPPSPSSKTFLQRLWFITTPLLLVLQNSASSLIVRYMKLNRDSYWFVNTSLVFTTELIKIILSLILFVIESKSWNRLKEKSKNELNLFTKESSKSIIPSILYCVQNNLLLVSISNLDAATFQVSYQLKIFTTALCLRLMLKKRLNVLQWLMLAVLFAGIVVVQTANLASRHSTLNNNPVVGFMAVAGACVVSGFTGVYSEKLLKKSFIGTWARNVQFAFYGSIVAGITMAVNDWQFIRANGIAGGYRWLTWIVVLIQSLGGLLVAVVIKTHDNIIKGFSNASAIILSTIFGVLFLDTKLSVQFGIGMMLVAVSILIYLNAKSICKYLGKRRNEHNTVNVEEKHDDLKSEKVVDQKQKSNV